MSFSASVADERVLGVEFTEAMPPARPVWSGSMIVMFCG